MIMDYLLMSYIALASCWPVTLILLSVAVVVLLHAERRVLNVSIVVLVGFLVLLPGSSGRQCVAPFHCWWVAQLTLYILSGKKVANPLPISAINTGATRTRLSTVNVVGMHSSRLKRLTSFLRC